MTPDTTEVQFACGLGTRLSKGNGFNIVSIVPTQRIDPSDQIGNSQDMSQAKPN